MSIVTDVSVALRDHTGAHGTWDLSVTYSVQFDEWERDAWFREQISVVGTGDAGETTLFTLSGPPFQATSVLGAPGSLVAPRHTPTFTLELLESHVPPTRTEMDKVYVSVRLESLIPSSHETRSAVQEVPCGRLSR